MIADQLSQNPINKLAGPYALDPDNVQTPQSIIDDTNKYATSVINLSINKIVNKNKDILDSIIANSFVSYFPSNNSPKEKEAVIKTEPYRIEFLETLFSILSRYLVEEINKHPHKFTIQMLNYLANLIRNSKNRDVYATLLSKPALNKYAKLKQKGMKGGAGLTDLVSQAIPGVLGDALKPNPVGQVFAQLSRTETMDMLRPVNYLKMYNKNVSMYSLKTAFHTQLHSLVFDKLEEYKTKIVNGVKIPMVPFGSPGAAGAPSAQNTDENGDDGNIMDTAKGILDNPIASIGKLGLGNMVGGVNPMELITKGLNTDVGKTAVDGLKTMATPGNMFSAAKLATKAAVNPLGTAMSLAKNVATADNFKKGMSFAKDNLTQENIGKGLNLANQGYSALNDIHKSTGVKNIISNVYGELGKISSLPTGNIADMMPNLPTNQITNAVKSLPTADFTDIQNIVQKIPTEKMVSMLSTVPKSEIVNAISKTPHTDLLNVMQTLPENKLKQLAKQSGIDVEGEISPTAIIGKLFPTSPNATPAEKSNAIANVLNKLEPGELTNMVSTVMPSLMKTTPEIQTMFSKLSPSTFSNDAAADTLSKPPLTLQSSQSKSIENLVDIMFEQMFLTNFATFTPESVVILFATLFSKYDTFKDHIFPASNVKPDTMNDAVSMFVNAEYNPAPMKNIKGGATKSMNDINADDLLRMLKSSEDNDLFKSLDTVLNSQSISKTPNTDIDTTPSKSDLIQGINAFSGDTNFLNQLNTTINGNTDPENTGQNESSIDELMQGINAFSGDTNFLNQLNKIINNSSEVNPTINPGQNPGVDSNPDTQPDIQQTASPHTPSADTHLDDKPLSNMPPRRIRVLMLVEKIVDAIVNTLLEYVKHEGRANTISEVAKALSRRTQFMLEYDKDTETRNDYRLFQQFYIKIFQTGCETIVNRFDTPVFKVFFFEYMQSPTIAKSWYKQMEGAFTPDFQYSTLISQITGGVPGDIKNMVKEMATPLSGFSAKHVNFNLKLEYSSLNDTSSIQSIEIPKQFDPPINKIIFNVVNFKYIPENDNSLQSNIITNSIPFLQHQVVNSRFLPDIKSIYQSACVDAAQHIIPIVVEHAVEHVNNMATILSHHKNQDFSSGLFNYTVTRHPAFVNLIGTYLHAYIYTIMQGKAHLEGKPYPVIEESDKSEIAAMCLFSIYHSLFVEYFHLTDDNKNKPYLQQPLNANTGVILYKLQTKGDVFENQFYDYIQTKLGIKDTMGSETKVHAAFYDKMNEYLEYDKTDVPKRTLAKLDTPPL